MRGISELAMECVCWTAELRCVVLLCQNVSRWRAIYRRDELGG
jgi:hypothetical protein